MTYNQYFHIWWWLDGYRIILTYRGASLSFSKSSTSFLMCVLIARVLLTKMTRITENMASAMLTIFTMLTCIEIGGGADVLLGTRWKGRRRGGSCSQWWFCSAWPKPKLNTEIGLHTHHHHPSPQTVGPLTGMIGSWNSVCNLILTQLKEKSRIFAHPHP